MWGANRGYQTCFLAREYDIFAVGIDPSYDRQDKRPVVEHIRENSIKWNVSHQLLAIGLKVPETLFASNNLTMSTQPPHWR